MSSYIVKTEYFEGPFDLLLFLVKKHEMDIENIELSKIIKDYLFYLNSKEYINIDREVDFLEVAATLIFLKSRSLIPKTKEEEEKEDEIDFLFQIEEYAKIRNAALYLLKRGEENKNTYPVKVILEEDGKEYEIKKASVFSLSEAFFKLLKKHKDITLKGLTPSEYRVEDKMDEILKFLKKEETLNFSELFFNLPSLIEAFYTFFALLELIKKRKILAFQREHFGDIIIFRRRRRRNKYETYRN